MKLDDLEKYREEDGYINIDKAIENNPHLTEDIIRENRGSQNREKDWIQLEDIQILLRTENLADEGVLYTSYAELVIEEVAKQVELPSAHYDLIKYKGEKGVLSKNVLKEENDVLISGSTLLRNIEHYNNTEDMLDFIDIEEIFESFNYLSKYDNFKEEDILKLRKQMGKVAIFDIFTMNTDRNGANFAVTYNSIKKRVDVSDIFDNEHSLGGGLSKEVVKAVSENKFEAKAESENLLSVLEAPADYSEESLEDWKELCPRIEESKSLPLNWQTLLLYIEDNSDTEELSEFFNTCYKNINIEKAFEAVEARIKSKVPEEYKMAVSNLYDERKSYINDALCLEEDLEYEDRNSLE